MARSLEYVIVWTKGRRGLLLRASIKVISKIWYRGCTCSDRSPQSTSRRPNHQGKGWELSWKSCFRMLVKGDYQGPGPTWEKLAVPHFWSQQGEHCNCPSSLVQHPPMSGFQSGCFVFSFYGLHFEEAVTIIPEARKFQYNCMVSSVWFRSITVACKRTHPMPAGPGSQPEGQRKSFFLKELIRKIVLKD